MNNHIGINLRYMRRLYRFTLQDISNRTGLARRTLERYEYGDCMPTQKSLKKIANVFNMPEEIFYSKPDKYVLAQYKDLHH